MFVTESLNKIPELIKNGIFSEKLKSRLNQKFVNLEATLLRAKVLRELSNTKVAYIVQSAIYNEQSSLAFLFSPFVFGNLNQSAIYHSQATAPVFNILNRYYQVEKKQNLKVDDVLGALNIYLDVDDHHVNEVDFFYFALINALCRPDVSQIFLISHLSIDPQTMRELEQFFKIKIHYIYTDASDKIGDSAELNMRKLLFKNKDQTHIELCEKFSKLIGQLLYVSGYYSQEHAIRLVEDMFYAEHIYEKLSVYAEYMQTCLQQSVSRNQTNFLV